MISARLTGRDSLLFVYGTLRAFVDIPMAQWLRRTAHYVGPATTRGRLYDLGPYPGLRPGRHRSETVVGDVYRVTDPRVFRVLDRYEAGTVRTKARFVRGVCVVKLDAWGPQSGVDLSLLSQRRRCCADFERRLSRSLSHACSLKWRRRAWLCRRSPNRDG